MRSTYVVVCLALAGLVACGDNLQGNRPPDARDSNVTTAEDTPVSFTVDVTDPDGDGELMLTFTAPEHGTITRDGTTVTYTPEADYHGSDSIFVDVTDGMFDTSALITITVTPVNDAPIAVDDALAGNEDQVVVVTGTTLAMNDTDVEDDALTVTGVANPSSGAVSFLSDTIRFTPTGNFTGTATFQYTVTDGVATDVGTVTVTVGGVNDPPVAVANAMTTPEDTAGTITEAMLVANDTDPEGQTLSVTGVAGAVNGTVMRSGGTVTFTPNANFAGAASFTYTVSDGAATATGTVNVTVTPVNDTPVANAGTATTGEDTPVTITLAGSDIEGSNLTFAIGTQPTRGSLGAITPVNATSATVVYTPTANLNGADSFTFTVNDGTATSMPATVSITVNAANDPPVANAQSVMTGEDMAVQITVVGADVDGDSLTFSTGTGPTAGSLSTYTVLTATTSRVTYTPNPNANGSDSFTIIANDGTVGSAPATISITVTAANDAPVATPGATTTPEDNAVTITLAGTDTEGQSLTFAIATGPTNGSLGTITQASATTATVTYTPNLNNDQDDSFTFNVNDGTATSASPATVSIDVTPVNDGPTANPNTDSTLMNTNLVRNASQYTMNDTDVDGPPLTVESVGNPANGSVSIDVPTQTITFTPAPNYFGPAGFDYTVTDGFLDSTARVTVTVVDNNTPPNADPDNDTTPEDTPLVQLASVYTANDDDPDPQVLTITAVQNPSNGVVSLNAGTITFTPTTDFVGNGSFDYVLSDGLATDIGTVTVAITSVNDLPVAQNDSAGVNEDGSVNTNVLSNDTGLGDGGIVVTVTTQATNGVAVAQGNNTVTYTPNGNYNGPDAYSYTVTDTNGDVSTAVVNITVNPVNDAPVAQSQNQTMPENTSLIVTLTATDIDVPAQALTFAIATGPTNGTLGAVVSTGMTTATVTYTPTAQYTGPDSFTFTATDSIDTSLPATVAITVNNVVVCNDGFVELPEQCDDQGNGAGDGCSPACMVEPGWNCVGQPSNCDPICNDGIRIAGEEECDDGNAVETDGCTTLCQSGPPCHVGVYTGGDRFATNPADGHCYVSFDGEQTTWANAQTLCAVSPTAHLVSITSAAEQTVAASVQNPAENPWIGLTDALGEGNFGWITAEPLGFTNWSMNQPDGGDPEDCVNFFNQALSSTGVAGTWNDTACDFIGFTAGRVCEIETNPCGDGITQGALGEQCDDTNRSSYDGCSSTCYVETLFFSEYLEGSSNNKAVEIANPGLAPVNLTGCSLRLYTNGSATVSQQLALTATIAAGDVFVACHPSINAAVAGQCDVTSSTVINFNGDDAVELFCAAASVDTIGQTGFRPVPEWGTGLTSTLDNTIRRKCSVTRGDTVPNNVFDPAIEWGGFATDTFGGIGSYQCVP